MEFSRCFLFVTFVVLTVDQFVVGDGLLEHTSSDFSENQRRHYKDDEV